MVTSYYLLNLKKNGWKSMDIHSYYSELFKTFSDDIFMSKKLTRCRVCLQEGKNEIYDNGKSNVAEAFKTFSLVDISESDPFPKRLCDVCFKFLHAAIMFRKIAKRSDEVLRKANTETKIENLDFSPHTADYDLNNDIEEHKEIFTEKDTVKSNSNEILTQKKGNTHAKITCQVCNKVINRSYYKEHLTMHEPNHKKYVCDVCGKSFRLRCAYYNHSLRHRNDFHFKCQFCEYRGRYAELLKMHMRTHTGEYRYMCTECPARFLYKSNLNTHTLVHKEPQQKCGSCNRAFYTKSLLKKHYEADHLGIKNHVCNVCGKAFGYRNAMMKHQRCVHKREKLSFGRMPSYLQAEQKNQNEVIKGT